LFPPEECQLSRVDPIVSSRVDPIVSSSAVDIDAYLTEVNPAADRQTVQDRAFKDLLPIAKELQRRIRIAGGE
jgi:hypothetical protein